MTICDKCGLEYGIGDYPFCKGGHGKPTWTVVSDECDVTIEHGLCWEDGSPRRFTSKAEMNQVAKEKGFVNAVRHVGRKGSDKSKITTRWV